MRFVPVKSDDQLDLQSLHRVRERWVMRRTAVVNQIVGSCWSEAPPCAKAGATRIKHYPAYSQRARPSWACVARGAEAGTGATSGEDRPC